MKNDKIVLTQMPDSKEFWAELEEEDRRRKKMLKWDSRKNYDNFNESYLAILNSINEKEIPTINVGEIVTGTINKISKREIVVDCNYKDSIFVDVKSTDTKIVQNFKIGDVLDVLITEIKEKPYEIKGSVTELIKVSVAEKIKQYYKDDLALDALVTGMIPAGFMLDIEMDNITVPAFMPNTIAGINKLTDEQNQTLLGQRIKVMMETLQQEKGVYVVSRRKYLNSLISEEVKKLKKNFVYTGKVTGTKEFGVFVEFAATEDGPECLTGMIHKVNMNPDVQDKLLSIQPGTLIEFYLRDVLKGNKLILTQILRDSLWDTISVGQIMDATIKSIKPFGVLVSLDDETVGLIQNLYLNKNQQLNEGDKIKVKIISIIKDDRKIYLSLP